MEELNCCGGLCVGRNHSAPRTASEKRWGGGNMTEAESMRSFNDCDFGKAKERQQTDLEKISRDDGSRGGGRRLMTR